MQGRLPTLRLALLFRAGLIAAGPCLAGDPTPQGRVTYQPSPDTGEPAWIATTPDGVLRFKAVVAGRTVDAMADTGVTVSAIDRRSAETLGSTVSAKSPAIPITGIGGEGTAYPGPTVTLSFPSYTIENLQTLVVDLAPFHAPAGHAIDMMLGLDVLGSGALELALADRGWRMWPSGIQWPDATTVPLRRTESGNFVFVTIAVENRPLRLLVDTGHTGGLQLTAAVAETIEAVKRGRRTSLAVQGVNGQAVDSVVVLAHLQFGAAKLSEVAVQFGRDDADPPPEGFDGMIGLELLRRLHVAMDLLAGTFFYAADERATKPLVRSTIGLQALWDGSGVRVAHVMANSPAAAAGWKAGDRICAVDGTAVADRGDSGAPYPWSVKPPGTRLTFRLCDGTERTLVAQSFY